MILYFIEKELPSWLKVLCLIASYSHNDKELQLSAITTLFDLIRLVFFLLLKFIKIKILLLFICFYLQFTKITNRAYFQSGSYICSHAASFKIWSCAIY